MGKAGFGLVQVTSVFSIMKAVRHVLGDISMVTCAADLTSSRADHV